ncbi:allantoin catabolism protein [Metarhizium robertsii ARSEF 23]|uniref:Allantoin catabolism protein n=2 Tax=Metarhizium robertsii TaxID=568076 RepID=E9ESC7_METRA|nr:allantoin catabolism protein [Metarhizium robertsii ARSEF 23]EFZ01644.2 allantoin catabolism protein [Metarhizium robertsii ARSEF 23]
MELDGSAMCAMYIVHAPTPPMGRHGWAIGVTRRFGQHRTCLVHVVPARRVWRQQLTLFNLLKKLISTLPSPSCFSIKRQPISSSRTSPAHIPTYTKDSPPSAMGDNNVRSYFAPAGGLPPQTQLLTDRAMFTEAYAVIPKGTFSDIVTSFLPFWDQTRLWVIARPLSGFAETFSQYIMEVQPGGGSDRPELDDGAEGVVFVVEGNVTITMADEKHVLAEGGYAYLPPKSGWTLRNTAATTARFHWIRKAYEYVDGLGTPEPLFLNEKDIAPCEMLGTNGAWATTRFVDPCDVRHDMHVNIVTFEPGGVIPFAETHVMEHGLYVLQGKAVYRLNQDWVEVEAGDFMWLRAFCPQACYAGGPGKFRYLLYKDVNRHMKLSR